MVCRVCDDGRGFGEEDQLYRSEEEYDVKVALRFDWLSGEGSDCQRGNLFSGKGKVKTDGKL